MSDTVIGTTLWPWAESHCSMFTPARPRDEVAFLTDLASSGWYRLVWRVLDRLMTLLRDADRWSFDPTAKPLIRVRYPSDDAVFWSCRIRFVTRKHKPNTNNCQAWLNPLPSVAKKSWSHCFGNTMPISSWHSSRALISPLASRPWISFATSYFAISSESLIISKLL